MLQDSSSRTRPSSPSSVAGQSPVWLKSSEWTEQDVTRGGELLCGASCSSLTLISVKRDLTHAGHNTTKCLVQIFDIKCHCAITSECVLHPYFLNAQKHRTALWDRFRFAECHCIWWICRSVEKTMIYIFSGVF